MKGLFKLQLVQFKSTGFFLHFYVQNLILASFEKIKLHNKSVASRKVPTHQNHLPNHQWRPQNHYH